MARDSLRRLLAKRSRSGRVRRVFRGPVFALWLIFGTFLMGTLGYHIIEKVSLFDAFYFTVVTLTTIGYGEMPHFDTAGRAFTIILVIVNLGVFSYAIGSLTQFVISGTIADAMGVRRMQKDISQLFDHFIVCGYGRLGETVAEQLEAFRRPFLIIELDPEKVERIKGQGRLVVEGDATDDKVLEMAGIERASTVIVATPNDPINVYITLTVHSLNPRAVIIARAVGDNSEDKLLRAGAQRVVSPIDRGAVYMAQAALRPSVVDFLDVTSTPGGENIQLEELVVPPGSFATGKSLGELAIGHHYSLMVVAIRHSLPRSSIEFNPRAASRVEIGDTLVILGRLNDLTRFERDLQGNVTMDHVIRPKNL